jgi:hypothetical protein
MTPISKNGFLRSWDGAWAACVLLMLALCFAGLGRAVMLGGRSHRAVTNGLPVSDGGIAISELNDHSQIRNYFMDFAGDHSLNVATVIEHPSGAYTRYTVELHLASGAEQSVVVSAPPGGLQVEMHDMTGDKISNDVVLRPSLLRWLPTVLVNDGHEHFEVVVSGTDPHSFSSSEDLGSRRRDSQTFALLMTSGFKTIHLSNSRGLFDPELRECFFSSFTQASTELMGRASNPGRAPPLATAV